MRKLRAREGGIASRQMSISTGSAEGGGQVVLETRNLTVQVPGQETELVRHFNAIIKRTDRLGIVGPNGIGKSSLVRVLLGKQEPSAGYVKAGFGMLPAYFDQNRALLNPEASPWTVLCPDGGEMVEVDGKPRHVTSYLRDFLFDEYKMTQRVATLSGGEQNRLMLAQIFAQPHNFLVLDEPTNDLDIETIDLLQEVIANYDGTVLIVSHDRDFLDRTVTATLAFEEEGKIVPHAGGYSDYLARRKEQTAKTHVKKKAKAKIERTKQPRTDRLSYKQNYLLQTLPGQIEQLEKDINDAQEKLADMNFFSADPDAYQKLATQLEQYKDKLEIAEQEWLELEILREEIETG